MESRPTVNRQGAFALVLAGACCLVMVWLIVNDRAQQRLISDLIASNEQLNPTICASVNRFFIARPFR